MRNRYESFTVIKQPRRFQGFTLIELLIVVAIILILVAITLPNFAAARIRAQVARVKADIKTIANALEAYHITYNRHINPYYPCHITSDGSRDILPDGSSCQGPFFHKDLPHCTQIPMASNCLQGARGGFLILVTNQGTRTGIGMQLTTPNKFLGEIPIDPFMTGALALSVWRDLGTLRYVEAASVYSGCWEARVTFGWYGNPVVLDEHGFQMQSYGPDYVQDGDQLPPSGNGFVYSPTNGVDSYGDIRYYSQFGFASNYSGSSRPQ